MIPVMDFTALAERRREAEARRCTMLSLVLECAAAVLFGLTLGVFLALIL